MRIKKLTIQNMNSIYGAWEIDFQDAAYVNSPLFAITGKTGSGKSTILDAISFALYDQTDRMSNKRSEFASKGTLECMAELIFEVDGIEYCSHSTLKAVTKGINGGKYDDSVDKNGCWLQWTENGVLHKEEGTNAKTAKIKQLLGLDFKQFCQVILLAQGKFNAFLSEDSTKRADILEKITGTAIYSRIGEKIAEKRKAAVDECTRLQEQLEGIQVLTDEEVLQKNNRLVEIDAETKEIETNIKQLEGQLDTDNKRLECRKQLLEKEQAEQQLAHEEAEFAQEMPRLEAARTAAKVTPFYQEYKTVADEQERDQKSLDTVNANLPQLKQKAAAAKAACEKDEQNLKSAEERKTAREAFLQKIDQLDAETRQLETARNGQQKKCAATEASLKKRQSGMDQLDKTIAKLSADRQAAETYLKEHDNDKSLETNLSGWQTSCAALQKNRSQLKRREADLKTLQANLANAQADVETALETLLEKQAAETAATADLQKAEEELQSVLDGRTVEEIQQDVDEQRKTVMLLKALNPKEHLKSFAEGTPCPVCGSTHHPYRTLPPESLPDLEHAQTVLKSYEKRVKDAAKCSQAVTQAKLTLANAQGVVQTAVAKRDSQIQIATKLKDDVDKAAAICQQEANAFKEAISLLHDDLAYYGFAWNGDEKLPAEISARIKQFNAQKTLVEGFEKQQAELLQKKAAMEGEQTAENTTLEKEQAELTAAENTLKSKKQTRQDLYHDGKTADERRDLDKAVATARTAKDASAKAFTTAENDVHHAETEVTRLTTAMASRMDDINRAKTALDTILNSNALSLESYLANLLPQSEFDSLVAKEASLKERRTTLLQSVQTLQDNLKILIDSLPQDFDRQSVEEQKDSLLKQMNDLSEERGGIRQLLETNDANRKKTENLRAEYEARQKDAVRWERLHKWIGGDNFKKLAQAYTFENLLVKANEQLHNMLGGRYQMCSHQEADGLEIDVIDNQLGGDVRTSKNLSGGEQFVISMALALGLSSMVGEKFRVDSLFLDEGFGTLDGHELEEAMNTLSQLRGDGKLVGIITHAERLQERIPTRICLEKHGNGRSTLEGPGIRKLADAVLYVSPAEKARRKKLNHA
ncbi:MAG: AAA family ATPase [Lentisphaeria bacterium]|nr:AAA family ATPase [Lentisphaeria bacterium]